MTGPIAAPTPDRFGAARAVADAVLYEGYVLYPYRASAPKNQVRWQFGVVVPACAAFADGSERSEVCTEVIVDPGDAPALTVRVRFLQIQHRSIDHGAAADGSWDEAREHEIDLEPVPLLPLAGAQRSVPFHVDGGTDIAVDGDERVVRRREALDGHVAVDVDWADGPGALIRVALRVTNTVQGLHSDVPRVEVVRHSLVGTHVLLAVDDATFVSSMDPPDDARVAVNACTNDGLYPVLIGPRASADVVLASPIILYDHPEVASESQGDMFDATEIDEILALRVVTLTDEEKDEARRTDPRAAAIIERCDAMGPEQWEGLHGVMRTLPPSEPAAAAEPLPWWEPTVDESFDPFMDTLLIGGVEVAVGTPVRLRPNRRADAHDMFLAGMAATVRGVFTDVDDDVLVAVSIDDDPATEALSFQGRYLFFHPDEMEVCS
jgi:hypothetical protein